MQSSPPRHCDSVSARISTQNQGVYFIDFEASSCNVDEQEPSVCLVLLAPTRRDASIQSLHRTTNTRPAVLLQLPIRVFLGVS
jgi:hypothetical protein